MKKLIQAARTAQNNAHAPYSNYKVGAAVVTENNEIVVGCNVESSSYGLTCCAERTALFSAIAQGYKHFTELAVFTENGGTPCGACRQVIWDLCGNIPIYISDVDGNIEKTTSKELLPNAFDSEKLK
jgi:cytidine deaminase